jgi:hypothetical protein
MEEKLEMSIRPSAEAVLARKEEEASQRDTLLEIDFVNQELGKIKSGVPELAQTYSGDMNPLFTKLAEECGGVWRDFEKQSEPMLLKAAADASNAINNFEVSRETALEEYETSVAAARGPLMDGLKATIREQRALNLQRQDRLKLLRERHKATATDLRILIISLTGLPDGVVDKVNGKLAAALVTAAVVLFGILETVGGFGLFKWKLDAKSAAAGSIMLVAALLVSGYFVGNALARIMQYYTCKRNFRVYFPNGIDTKTGQRVYVRPIGLDQYLKALAFGLILVITNLIVVFWRQDVASQSARLAGTNILAVILMIASFVFAFGKMHVAPKFDKREMEDHDKLVSQQEALEREIKSLEDQGDVVVVQTAIDQYREDVEQSGEKVRGKSAEARDACNEFVAMHSEYAAATKTIRIEYASMANLLTEAVLDKNPLLNRAALGVDDQDTIDTIVDMIDAYVQPRDFSDLLDRIRDFNPDIPLSLAGVITEFDPLVEEARNTVDAEERTAREEEAKANAPVPIRARAIWSPRNR